MKWIILAALIFMTACEKGINLPSGTKNTKTAPEPTEPEDGHKPRPKTADIPKETMDILDKNPPEKLLSALPSPEELAQYKEGWKIQKKFNQPENENTIMAQATKNGQSIIVAFGNLFNEKVEAIVNAANGSLEGGGGIDGMIHDKALEAGKDLMKDEAIAYKKFHNIKSLPNGWAMATKPYGLKQFKLVIFTVGPSGQRTPEKELELFSAVYNSMKKASNFGMASIAATAISTGIFGFPKDIASRLFINAALTFFAKNPDSSIKTIYFTNFDEPTVNAVVQGFDEVFELVH